MTTIKAVQECFDWIGNMLPLNLPSLNAGGSLCYWVWGWQVSVMLYRFNILYLSLFFAAAFKLYPSGQSNEAGVLFVHVVSFSKILYKTILGQFFNL